VLLFLERLGQDEVVAFPMGRLLEERWERGRVWRAEGT